MKTCRCCAEVKDPTQFTKDRTTRDGLRSICRVCKAKQAAEYAAKYPDRVKAQQAKTREKHGDKYRARHREYMKTYTSKPVPYIYDPVSARRRYERYYAKHKARVLARAKVWREANPSKMNAAVKRYRTAKANALPAWADLKAISEFYFAADFLGMVTGEWHHVDHIVPLQGKTVCGLHTEANLQVLPGAENQSKGNRFWPDMP